MRHEGEWTAVWALSWSRDCVSLLCLLGRLWKHLATAEYISCHVPVARQASAVPVPEMLEMLGAQEELGA